MTGKKFIQTSCIIPVAILIWGVYSTPLRSSVRFHSGFAPINVIVHACKTVW